MLFYGNLTSLNSVHVILQRDTKLNALRGIIFVAYLDFRRLPCKQTHLEVLFRISIPTPERWNHTICVKLVIYVNTSPTCAAEDPETLHTVKIATTKISKAPRLSKRTASHLFMASEFSNPQYHQILNVPLVRDS